MQPALDTLFDALRPQAVLVVVSIWGHPGSVDMQKLVLKEIDMRGTIAYVNNHPETIDLVAVLVLRPVLRPVALVLGALTAYGLVVGERLMPRPHDDLVTVRAEGRQWEWRFGYADAPGRETRDVLHIPAGRPVDVEITTADVIHSFWVPRLAGKLDAIPGHVNVLRIEADGPGEFKGVSAEFNGTGYLAHRFRVIAHDPAGWQRFLAGATE